MSKAKILSPLHSLLIKLAGLVRRSHQGPRCDGQKSEIVGNDRQFQELCVALKAPALSSTPKYAKNPDRVKHRDQLINSLQLLIVKNKRDALVKMLSSRGVPAAPILSYEQFSSHPFLAWWRQQAAGASPALIPSPFIIDGKRSKQPFHKALGQI